MRFPITIPLRKQEAEDVLKQKKRELSSYTSQFDRAVSLVTSTIDNLNALDENIQKTIGEIEEYQNELNSTKGELVAAQSKNQRVIENFKSLLAVE